MYIGSRSERGTTLALDLKMMVAKAESTHPDIGSLSLGVMPTLYIGWDM